MADRVPITVPSMLRDLMPWYLDHSRATLAEMEASLSSGDFSAVASGAHGLKGSGGSYGMPRITELGAAVETAAKAEETAEIRAGIAALRDFLERVEITFTD